MITFKQHLNEIKTSVEFDSWVESTKYVKNLTGQRVKATEIVAKKRIVGSQPDDPDFPTIYFVVIYLTEVPSLGKDIFEINMTVNSKQNLTTVNPGRKKTREPMADQKTALTIYALREKAIRKLLSEIKPNAITSMSSSDDGISRVNQKGETETSRNKLYRRLFNRIARDFNYKVREDKEGYYLHITLYKDSDKVEWSQLTKGNNCFY